MKDYSEFFYNGVMDNNMEFGYTISIDSIEAENGEYVATITIEKQ